MGSPIDILGVGCVAVDDLVYVPDYPTPGSKTQVTRRERHWGQLTAADLVAAATAALSATRSGGQARIPARQAVLAFFEEQV